MATFLAKVTNPFVFPSGEGGEYTFWVADFTGVSTLSNASAFALQYANTLAASTPFKALFPSTAPFLPQPVAEVDIATGKTIATTMTIASIVPTGSLSSVMPPQCATAIALRTTLAGGVHRGRMFMPGMITTNLTAAGRYTTASCTALVTAVAAAFNAAIAAVPLVQPVVYSRELRIATGVATIDCGDVVDTQRRRRDKLIENRQSIAI